MAAAVFNGRPVVLSGSIDGTLRAWDLITREPLGDALTGHTGWASATAIAIVDGNPVAVTGSTDGTVRLWNLSNEKQVIGNRLQGHSGPINSLECARLDDRSVAVTGSDDGTVRTWDAETGEPIGDIPGGHNGPVKAACAMRKDRPIAVAASEAPNVRA
jgi:WD40 repeat protein